MPRALLATFAATVALLAMPAVASAGPGMVVGAVEDHLRASSLVEAEARMRLFRLSGFRAARVTSYWTPGAGTPTDGELETLRLVAQAAARNGVRVYLTVMHPGSRTTPLTPEARAEFASYAATIARRVRAIRHVIVANEPNLNRFWLPQFGDDGASVSPGAYLALLEETYDALKRVAPEIEVLGGALGPRGSDRPGGARPTHSPTRFIQELGSAYRASGRAQPVMDAFVMHVYADNSSQPPSTPHPNTRTIALADYGKLVTLLGEAFDGTAQRGSTLPVLYGEFGVESQIPPAKEHLYSGVEPAATRPVPEETQAAFYEEALRLAFCQPNVTGILLFLSRDEPVRAGWQSGLYYADGTPKSSLPRVTRALDRAAGGSIARCVGMRLTVRPLLLRFGTRAEARRGVLRVTFRCDLDCTYRVRLEDAATGATRVGRRGRANAQQQVRVDLAPARLRPGVYRYTLRLVHPVNPAAPTLVRSPALRVP